MNEKVQIKSPTQKTKTVKKYVYAAKLGQDGAAACPSFS